jgi:inner membrane protein
MDPFSHGILGAITAQNISKKEHIKKAAIYGGLAALAPDLDIFIKSNIDSLLNIEYHRHFTHSIFFAPFFSIVVTAFWWLIFRKNISFKLAYLFALTGMITHGLLDGSTSYGTRVFWPFSQERVSWSLISIIDPLFTFPLLAFVIIAAKKQSKKIAAAGFAYVVLYLGFGYIQWNRVEDESYKLAAQRGHKIEKLEVKPTLANNILWRSTYISNGRIYADSIRVGYLGNVKIYEGENIKVLKFPDDFKRIDKNSTLYNDIARFNFFSNDFMGQVSGFDNFITDARYSINTQGFEPMWGLKIDAQNPNNHAKFERKKNRFKGRITENFKNQLFDF